MKTSVRQQFLRRSAMATAICLASLSLSTAAYAGCSNSSASTYDPYSIVKFRGALDKSVHQYNTGGSSSSNCVSNSELRAGDWADKSGTTTEDYFYNKYETGIGDTLVFKINEGAYARSELRANSFNATASRPLFRGDFLIRGAYASMPEEFTVAQIHIDLTSTYGITSSPMLRMEFRKSASYDGATYSNYIWAIFRPDPTKNSGTGAYDKVPIAPARFGGGSSDINNLIMDYNIASSTDNTVKVVVNGATRYFSVKKWIDTRIKLYHKAGCYTQTSGSCTIQYSKLELTGY